VIAITVWVSWWAWLPGASAPGSHLEWTVGSEFRSDLDQPAPDLLPYGAASERPPAIRPDEKPALEFPLAFGVDIPCDQVREQPGFPFDWWDRSG
jgi:hypothetical protein